MKISETFCHRRVLVTGHTGFKGTWLSLWLRHLGAEVFGLSLAPEKPSICEQVQLPTLIREHRIGDIRDPDTLNQAVGEIQPDFIFHLAAQPLVRRSYRQPIDTYQTNVIGTLNILEALRGLAKPCAAVMVTTDKCYENLENGRPYSESDALGGHDPYSSSKACAEIAIASWRHSFFPAHGPIAIASARAGNVIGGGDWAEARIIPDAIRHLSNQEPIAVRNPAAVRPWQHVLDPLCGYLMLAAALWHDSTNKSPDRQATQLLRSAFNFGPPIDTSFSVQSLIEEILRHWPGQWQDASDPHAPHEAALLHLDISLAKQVLDWRPQWDFSTSIAETVKWYRFSAESEAQGLLDFSNQQIQRFQQSAAANGLIF